MKSRVLLISTSYEEEARSKERNPNTHYPLGLAYIHSYLESRGHEVDTLFLNDYPFEECLGAFARRVNDFHPDVVGVQIFSHNRASSFRTIEYLRERHPDVKIVIGGIHASILHEQILGKYPFLVAVIGEGEVTFAELAERYCRGEDISAVEGIAYSLNGKVVWTPPREIISDLDALPFPKHEIYFSSERKTANLLTSRGCPFRCSFCCLDTVSQRKVRFRSVDNVIREIEHLKTSFPGLNTVWIHDDSFLLNNERAISICKEIKKRDFRLKFICSGRMKPISGNLVRSLEEAGFVHVLFGLESGSAKVLEICRKGITPEDAVRAFELFRDSPIELTAFLIVGLYGEDDRTVSETIELVQRLQKIKYAYYDDIGVLIVYPGTEIYSIAKEAGVIDDDFWLTEKPVPWFTVEHGVEELQRYKETIREAISLRLLYSYKGFMAQKRMLPDIMRYRMKRHWTGKLYKKVCARISRRAGR